MKKSLLVIMIVLMGIICVSFTGNVMADDHAVAAAEEQMADDATDDATQAEVAMDEEEAAEAYSAPEGEEADMSDEEPADIDEPAAE